MWKIVGLVVLMASAARAETPAELNERGKSAMIAGDFKLASERFTAATAGDPQAKYFLNLCLARYQEGLFAAAARACEAVPELHPTDRVRANAEKWLAVIRKDADDQHIALDPISPDSAAGASAAGVDHMFAAEYDEAAASFRLAVERDPIARYFFNLCTAVSQLGRLSEAQAACEGAAMRSPSPELAAKISKALAKVRDDAAARHIELVPLPTPETKSGRAVWSDRDGRGLLAAGKLDEARMKFRDAVANDPKALYFVDLCDVAYRLGDREEALAACKAVTIHRPSSHDRSAAAGLVRKLNDL